MMIDFGDDQLRLRVGPFADSHPFVANELSTASPRGDQRPYSSDFRTQLPQSRGRRRIASGPLRDLANGVANRAGISPAEGVADVGPGQSGPFADKEHRHL